MAATVEPTVGRLLLNANCLHAPHRAQPTNGPLYGCIDHRAQPATVYGQTVLLPAATAAGLGWDADEAHSAVYYTEQNAKVVLHHRHRVAATVEPTVGRLLFSPNRLHIPHRAQPTNGRLYCCIDHCAQPSTVYDQTVLLRAATAAGLGWDADEAHSAVYDTEQTAKLFCTIANAWPRP